MGQDGSMEIAMNNLIRLIEAMTGLLLAVTILLAVTGALAR